MERRVAAHSQGREEEEEIRLEERSPCAVALVGGGGGASTCGHKVAMVLLAMVVRFACGKCSRCSYLLYNIPVAVKNNQKIKNLCWRDK